MAHPLPYPLTHPFVHSTLIVIDHMLGTGYREMDEVVPALMELTDHEGKQYTAARVKGQGSEYQGGSAHAAAEGRGSPGAGS